MALPVKPEAELETALEMPPKESMISEGEGSEAKSIPEEQYWKIVEEITESACDALLEQYDSEDKECEHTCITCMTIGSITKGSSPIHVRILNLMIAGNIKNADNFIMNFRDTVVCGRVISIYNQTERQLIKNEWKERVNLHFPGFAFRVSPNSEVLPDYRLRPDCPLWPDHPHWRCMQFNDESLRLHYCSEDTKSRWLILSEQNDGDSERVVEFHADYFDSDPDQRKKNLEMTNQLESIVQHYSKASTYVNLLGNDASKDASKAPVSPDDTKSSRSQAQPYPEDKNKKCDIVATISFTKDTNRDNRWKISSLLSLGAQSRFVNYATLTNMKSLYSGQRQRFRGRLRDFREWWVVSTIIEDVNGLLGRYILDGWDKTGVFDKIAPHLLVISNDQNQDYRLIQLDFSNPNSNDRDMRPTVSCPAALRAWAQGETHIYFHSHLPRFEPLHLQCKTENENGYRTNWEERIRPLNRANYNTGLLPALQVVSMRCMSFRYPIIRYAFIIQSYTNIPPTGRWNDYTCLHFHNADGRQDDHLKFIAANVQPVNFEPTEYFQYLENKSRVEV